MTLEQMISNLIDENYRLKVENYNLKKELEKLNGGKKNV